MNREYKVRPTSRPRIYAVVEIITKYGERTSAYESELDVIKENYTYQGNLSDCYAYIKLCEGGYFYFK